MSGNLKSVEVDPEFLLLFPTTSALSTHLGLLDLEFWMIRQIETAKQISFKETSGLALKEPGILLNRVRCTVKALVG